MKYFIGSSKYEGIQNSTVEDCLEYFKDKSELQVDTETTGKDPHVDKIISLQLGDKDNQWMIDAREIDIRVFKELLESKLCILQNSKFDYKMLKAIGIFIEYIYDTMLAECVLYCGHDSWGYSLDKLVARYCGVDMSKEERAGFTHVGDRPFTRNQVEYGLKDVVYLQDIKEKQEILAADWELEYCIDLENEVVKALGDMEYNGIILDKEEWMKVNSAYKLKKKKIEKELDFIISRDAMLARFNKAYIQADLFGGETRNTDVNYASPVQIKQIAHALGFKIESTEDKELTKLVNKHEFFKQLQELRKVSKIVSTYGEKFLKYINPATGKVHTSFWQVLETGRVSSGNKDDNAPNMQNIPAKNEFRNCFVARPGFTWVSIDFSGQELNLMAEGSKEPGFIDVLNRGEDLHCYAGSMMFRKTITKADKEERTKAKTINFGKPYGMGPGKLADELGISEEEAKDLFTMYAKAFPILNKWLEDQGKAAKRNGFSVTFAPCKRRRWYPDMARAKELRKSVRFGEKSKWKEILTIEGQTERNGGNAPIQGTGADITKEAMRDVRKLGQRYDKEAGEPVAFALMQVHDAIDYEVRDDLADKFAEEMGEIMTANGNKYVTVVKMGVDITKTKVWTK